MCQHLKYILFADDTNIFYSHDLVNIMHGIRFKKMYTWFCVNKLPLNIIAKTNSILFGKYRCEKHVALRIERVEATKWLGLVIDYR